MLATDTPGHYYFKEIGSILNDCQESTVTHKKNVKLFSKLLFAAKESLDLLIFSFIRHLNQVLSSPYSKKDGHIWVENAIVFFQLLIQTLLTNNDGEECTRFSSFLVKYLLQGVEAKERHIRCRILTLLSFFAKFVKSNGDLMWASFCLNLFLGESHL